MDRQRILVEVNLFETDEGVPKVLSAASVPMDVTAPLWESLQPLLAEHLPTGSHGDPKCYITETENEGLQEVGLSLRPKDSNYFSTVPHPLLFVYVSEQNSKNPSKPRPQGFPLPPSEAPPPEASETTPSIEVFTEWPPGNTPQLLRSRGGEEDKDGEEGGEGEEEDSGSGQCPALVPKKAERSASVSYSPLHKLSVPTIGVQTMGVFHMKTSKRERRLIKSTSLAEGNTGPRLKRSGCQVERKRSFKVNTFSSARVINAATRDTFTVNINALWTVADLKNSIAVHLGVPCDFDLTYESDGRELQLFDNMQIVRSTYLYSLWVQSGNADLPIVVKPHHIPSRNDGWALNRVSLITGVWLDRSTVRDKGQQVIYDGDLAEVEFARRLLHSFVGGVIHQRDAGAYSLSMEVESRATSTVLAQKIPPDFCIEVNFHFKQSFTLTRKTNVRSSANDILAQVFPCVLACRLVEARSQVDDYTFAVTGETSYVCGSTELIAFKEIRRCVFKGEPIHLSIVRKPLQSLDVPLHLSWLPIDPHTGIVTVDQQTPDEIKSEDCSSVLYLPTIKKEFTITIIKATNLLPSPMVSVEITMYHGHVPLCPPVSSSPVLLEEQGWAVWNEALSLDITVGHIPRDAKLMICVYSHCRHDDSSPCRQYWGLMNVIDFRSELVQGKVVRRLWRDRLPKQDAGYKYNPLAPPSNSPQTDACEVTILMESFSKPVFYPYCDRKKDKFKDLTTLLTSHELNGFPGYVARIKWNNPKDVLKLYSILAYLDQPQRISKIPIEQALNLLDSEYCDEQVRSFATLVLERLPDDQLEDVLLQLTQALKFDSNHASTLARFLLKRALQNKRIGHFFFWFMKCELYNAQYVSRFATILEAYLLGCGESMLASFEGQLDMQSTIEAMAVELKDRCKNDPIKMQEMLPQALKSRDATKFTFMSPYNPRTKLGDLQLNKCKIMGSKARPIWIEMRNKDENVLKASPVRLILKMRDDLRQDMITLRMFSLFEKLWEEEGLELPLIPYGCIATGPNGGFIEVVKNSKTIAEVSEIKNDKKLFEWIRSHQTNEYGEVDEDKVRAAIQRFTSSCAGYSVATYVLGIGDRHNDNVMVTTSGNLFHIDFGHFLGNIKHCMGIKREWVPFVLTPDFVYVMGGEGSKTFEHYKSLCCKAFLNLRRHAHLIINLISMMRSTGIPELRCVEDLEHVRKALAITMETEAEAEGEFLGVMKKCLDLKWTVQVMWKIHNMAKGSS